MIIYPITLEAKSALENVSVMKNLKITQRYFLPVLIVMVLIGWIAVPALAADPLSSWRDGTNKRLIIAFVEKVTTPDSPDFVAPENRVATFDMDGTVLLEKPAYSLFAFAIPLIEAAAAAQPELLERPHVKAIVDGNMKYFAKAGKFGPEGLYATLLETHSGKTEAEYAADANAFLFGQKHPRFQVPYAETVYLPMLEMIRYLKANGFRVYICSGSDIAFIRAMIETSIGLPVENAIGTQDAAFQKARGSIHERNHFRLWLAPIRYAGKMVWVGQISRDIGVRFTTKTITTHKIDPDVDETRIFLIQNLWYTGGLQKFAFVSGVGEAPLSRPRQNLTGDPYVTDGLRAVLWVLGQPVPFDAVEFIGWDIPPLN